MKKMIALLTAIMLLLSACSSATVAGAGKELEDTITNVTDADNKYVQMVKGGYRTDDPGLTYEEAFSAFFGTPRWKYFEGEDGQNVVEFTGDCTYQDVPVKARIQFVVDEENETFEATYLAFNEVPQNALTLAAVISKSFEEVKSNNQESGTGNSTDTDGQVLICGISVQNVMNMSAEDVIATFGEPDVYESDVYYDTDRIEYKSDQLCFIMSEDDSDGVFCLDAPAEKFTLNGQGLNLSVDDLISKLGDDYDILGGSGYQWNVDDLSYTFHISKEVGIGDIMEVSKIDTDSPSDNNAYLDDGSNYQNLDYDLCGRWRSYTGKSITLDEYGNVSASWRLWDYLDASPESVTWTASNGRLEIYALFRFSYAYTIGKEILYDQPSETLDLGDRVYYRDDTGTGAITGTWSPYSAMLGGDMTLYEDGTGYKDFVNQSFTWYADDTTYTELHTQGRAYDYTVSGDTLTLFFSDGAEVFTRVGD